MNTWDYIIVGAGSAGCAAASELARNGRSRVLLIEAGVRDRSPYIKIPALVAQACRKYDWGYASQPDQSRAGKTDHWLRGRVLGGSSSVNGMMYVRGASQDFDRWARAGNTGWSYADVEPLYREMESSDQQGAARGTGGPVHVRTVKSPHRLSSAFIESAVNAGFNFNPDYNSGTQEGLAYAQLSQRRGIRCSSADAFLTRLKSLPNFELLLNARAHRIRLRDGLATGVEVAEDSTVHFFQARHVVLCAGAINTPKLLMLSGLGDAKELEAFGIAAALHSPNVGKNLQEHPLVRLIYRTRIPSYNLTGGLLQRLKIAADFGLRRQGPISTLFEVTGFLKTSSELSSPDVQLHFLPMGIMNVSANESPFLTCPSVSVYVNKSYPKSRGAVRLASRDPADAPIIDCRLLEHPDDVETLVRGVGLVRRIVSVQPVQQWIEEEIAPGRGYSADEALRQCIPAQTEIAYHPVGTCGMGPDSAAVVAPDLRVNGVRNLWVADASVMPDLISGNTNAACMMIGMKLGRHLNACAH